MSKWDDNGVDMLLFDYLEGQLSEEGVIQLERELQTNSGLKNDLELWKETIVKQDFYPTLSLEDNLLKITKKPLYNFPLYSFLFVFIASVFIYTPIAHDNNYEPVKADYSSMSEEQMEIEESNRTTKAAEPIVMSDKADDRLEPEEAVENFTEVSNSNISNISLGVTAMDGTGFDLQVNNLTCLPDKRDVKKVKVKVNNKKKTISRADERKIRKMKEKALQQRQADEFRKGNVPYVVPLNRTNF